jgi:leucyl aminopeptidase (aminopeptidase T)
MADWAEGAKEVLRQTLSLQPNENVMVVMHESKTTIAEAFIEAGRRLGANVHSYTLSEGSILKEIPPNLKNTISQYDVFINILKTSPDETPFRVALIYKELENGGRVAHSPGLTEDMAATLFEIDYSEVKANVDRVMKAFEGALTARITSAQGTDITMNIKDRGFTTDIYIDNGKIGNLPAGEIWCSPVEDGANGKLVIDGSIGDLGMVPCVVVIDVKDGKVTNIECNDSYTVEHLKELLAVDEMSDVIGEFGIGMNPSAKITGNMLEDEKAFKTIHIAFGYNIDMPGGQNTSKTHRDFLIRNPTIAVEFEDGRKVDFMDNGNLLI